VEVNFIAGKKAILTIFKDGKEQEKVTLSDYNDKDRLHELFAQKGFQKYTGEEMVARRKMKETEDGKDVIASPLRGMKRKHNEIPEGSSLRGKKRNHNAIREGARNQPNSQLSPKLRKKQMKEKLKQLKNARENYMVVGAPRG